MASGDKFKPLDALRALRQARGLTLREKAVVAMLIAHTDNATGVAHPSHRALAAELACSEKSIQRIVETLTSKRVLVREREGRQRWAAEYYRGFYQSWDTGREWPTDTFAQWRCHPGRWNINTLTRSGDSGFGNV